MKDRKLIRGLRRQRREGLRMLKGLDPESDLHRRMAHRLGQLTEIIEELAHDKR